MCVRCVGDIEVIPLLQRSGGLVLVLFVFIFT